MLDIKKIRDDLHNIESSLQNRGYKFNSVNFQELDSKRKSLQIDVESLQADRKKLSSEFGKLKASGENAAELKKIIDDNNDELESKNQQLQEILKKIQELMLDMPNIPDESVPIGKNEDDNILIKECGSIVEKKC